MSESQSTVNVSSIVMFLPCLDPGRHMEILGELGFHDVYRKAQVLYLFENVFIYLQSGSC